MITRSRKKAVLSSPEVRRIVEQIKDYGPGKVILFGSTARGDNDEYSDVDLIVVKETGERFLQRLITVTGFLPKDLRIDVFVYTPEEFDRMVKNENPFIERALQDHVVIYEKAS